MRRNRVSTEEIEDGSQCTRGNRDSTLKEIKEGSHFIVVGYYLFMYCYCAYTSVPGFIVIVST